MKKLLSVLLVALLMVGCGEDSMDLDDPATRDKVIAGAIDGDKLEWRGEVSKRLAYAPNQQTPYTGLVKEMYDDGQVSDLYHLKDGKRDGLVIRWHENGQKMNEVTYKDGKSDGPFNGWYKNGNKKVTGAHKAGELNGAYTWWWENGQKSKEEIYNVGKLMTAVHWKPNGEKCPDTNVVDGNGIWVWYINDGTEGGRGTYKDGKEVLD